MKRYEGAKDWVTFKEWVRDCILRTHLNENYKKDGELKFPKYVAFCSCGDIDCSNRRTSNHNQFSGGPANLDSSINYHNLSQHGSWEDDEDETTTEVYVKESEVELLKGQIHNLSWEDRQDLIKRLKN